MRHTKLALAAMALAVLAGCGGTSSQPGNQTLRTKFSAQVTFGDSLSDVGSYAVGTVAALKGGKFTINGDNTAINSALTGKNWSELVAAQLGLPAPCAAVTGLDGDATKGLSVPVVAHAGCYGYAQGGARVTNPVGPGNKLTGSSLGGLTYPVATQIANHLAATGGKFKGDEIVFVMAGGNDVLFNLGALTAAATAAGNAAGAAAGATAYGQSLVAQLAAKATDPATAAQAIGIAMATESARPGSTQTTITQTAIGAAAVQPGASSVASPAVYGPMVAKATADATTAGTAAGAKAGADYAAAHGPELVVAMGQAGTELANLVKNQIIAKGASYVTVNNLPDVSITPSALAQSASSRALISAMVNAFNTALATGLGSDSKILLVDVFTVSHDESVNPGPYGLTNVTEPACDLSLAKNALGTSLTCNASNVKSGDVSHYYFADDVHPTPFTNLLLARLVAEKMVIKGWL
ncbi:MAG: SGNH/GDSL hydrolase family protein [Sphingomonadaceae bacterium]